MSSPPGAPTAHEVREALRAVIDPELGDDIVDLGMVGDIHVGGDGSVRVEVALTTAGCPLRKQLGDDVTARIRALDGVSGVEIKMGVMEAAAKAALMDRARRNAQRKALDTDIPPQARVLALSSGKGGVGKSSVTVNLAVALARRGCTVGLLDADIWGFSVPRLLGVDGVLRGEDGKIVPLERDAAPGVVRVVSMGFLAEEDTAIMWRGLILTRALQQFLEDVRWGDLDYLLVDMPPGTGDIQMGLARMLPRTEVLVVTTPPLAAQKVAVRAADMARRGHLRVAGVIENMAGFTCAHGDTYHLFGEGGGERLAREIGVPLVGQVPLDPALASSGDRGDPIAYGDDTLAQCFAQIAERLAEQVVPIVETSSCSARLIDAIDRAVSAAPSQTEPAAS